MGLTSFKVTPSNTADWDRFFRNVPVKPDPNSVGPTQLQVDAVGPDNLQTAAVTTAKLADAAVTNAKLANTPALSVKGQPTNAGAPPQDIQATIDGQFLVRRGTTLVFDALADADIPGSLARDAEVTAAVAAATGTITTAYQAADAAVTASIVTIGDARYVLDSNVLTGSVTYDPPSLADGAGATTMVTVTGAALGDFALASFSLDLQGITVTCYVSATDTVAVRLQNETGGTLDLASGSLKARVWK